MNHRNRSYVLITVSGDIVAMALTTVAGFARHGEIGTAGLRILTTFVPLCLAWGLIAPWVGLFRLPVISDPRQLWRPVLAAILAAPMAGWLRGLLLNEPVPLIFVVVIGATVSLPILIWRSLWLVIERKQVQNG